jgi:class 3 adenylate cyclase
LACISRAHIGARVAAQAGPGDLLATSTVRDRVAGSGIEFEDRGVFTMKGLPEPYNLFAVHPWRGISRGKPP